MSDYQNKSPMKKYILPIILLMSFFCTYASAQSDTGDVAPADIYRHVDIAPVFPGSVEEGLPIYVAKNFHYPTAAWRTAFVPAVPVSFVIRADGTTSNVKILRDVHPLLAKEIERLILNMPRWYPAYLNNKPANTEFRYTLQLVDPYLNLPYHVVPLIDKTRKYNDFSRKYNTGMKERELKEAMDEIEQITSVTPLHAPTTIAMTRLWLTDKNYHQATILAKTALKEYGSLNLYKHDKKNSGHDYPRPGYNGKNEIALALQRALACDEAGLKGMAHSAYTDLISLLDEKIRTKDIAVPLVGTSEEYHIEELIKRLTYRQMKELTSDEEQMRQMTYDDWKPLRYAVKYDDVNKAMDYLIAKGMIMSAKVLGTHSKIKELRREIAMGRLNKSDTLHLYELKAMAIGLRDGRQAETDYLKEIASVGSNRLQQLAGRLTEAVNQLPKGDSERRKAVHSIACMAPLNDASLSRKENKDAASEFYSYRETMCDTYPLDWLFSDTGY